MSDIVVTRTPEIVAAEIRALTATMLSNVIEIGRRMVEAKGMLPHGEFGSWLQENTGYSQRTANNFMRLFEAYGDQQNSLFGAQANSQTFANLPYSKALALLSVPESSREAFAQEVNAEDISLRELQEEIKKLRKRANDAEVALDGAELAMSEAASALEEERARTEYLTGQIEELKNRPVEVAVQAPSEEDIQKAVDERMREVEAAHRRQLQELTEKEKVATRKAEAAQIEAKQLDKKLKDARAELKKAVAAEQEKAAKKLREVEAQLSEKKAAQTGEAERLTQEIAALRKQIAMADEATVTFKLHFGQWQREFAAMQSALEKASPETAQKLRGAVQAQLNGWGGAVDG